MESRIEDLENRVTILERDSKMLSICIIILALGFVAFTFFL